jgi:hypothetical protein
MWTLQHSNITEKDRVVLNAHCLLLAISVYTTLSAVLHNLQVALDIVSSAVYEN